MLTDYSSTPHKSPAASGAVAPASVIDETYAMLYEGKDIRQAVRDLMARELKAED